MKAKKKGKKKGFTLIELLVVIAIIAILSVVVVLTLNPAEMLRRSRDSNRASDLATIKTAISLYLADVSTTYMGVPGTCYIQAAGTIPTIVNEFPTSSGSEGSSTVAYTLASSTANCQQWFNSANVAASTTSALGRSVAGTGWIPINLSLVSSGAPIGQWPADPAYSVGAVVAGNGNAGHFYSYIPGTLNNQYKLAAKMESTLYSQGGTSDLESTDGGVDPFMYEQGTNLAL